MVVVSVEVQYEMLFYLGVHATHLVILCVHPRTTHVLRSICSDMRIFSRRRTQSLVHGDILIFSRRRRAVQGGWREAASKSFHVKMRSGRVMSLMQLVRDQWLAVWESPQMMHHYRGR